MSITIEPVAYFAGATNAWLDSSYFPIQATTFNVSNTLYFERGRVYIAYNLFIYTSTDGVVGGLLSKK